MLGIERRQNILDLLSENKFLSVHKLASLLYASESTIRRDLEALSKLGLVSRTFGGAALVEGMNAEIPLAVREDHHNVQKEAIAVMASKLIHPDDILIVDSSSTAFKLLPYIRKSNTVITNSPKVSMELAGNAHPRVYSTGGHLRENSLSYVGRSAKNAVELFNCDTMFFSCVGISRESGMTDTSEEEAELKMTMMRHSRTNVAMIDSSKFDLVTFIKICDFDAIDYLITDSAPSLEWQQIFKTKNVKLLYP
jgi:DeoR/GlpR family transcriptional regulator of sugar metabolism